jgi:predicted secreted protein
MASSVAGRTARIKVATDSAGTPGTFNDVTGIKTVQHSIDGQTIDDSEFGIEWVQSIVGLPGGKLSMSGGRRSGDTTGQNVLQTALTTGVFVHYKWLYTGSAGFQQKAIVTKFAVSADVNDRVTVDIDLAGTGAITAV